MGERSDPRDLPPIGVGGLIHASFEGLASGSHLLIYQDRIEKRGWTRKNSPTDTLLVRPINGAKLTKRRFATSEVEIALTGGEHRKLLFNDMADAETVHQLLLRLAGGEQIQPPSPLPPETPMLATDDAAQVDAFSHRRRRPGTIFGN